ncbi:hypothetical protein EG864_16055, partial [Enterococcus faecalis]
REGVGWDARDDLQRFAATGVAGDVGVAACRDFDGDRAFKARGRSQVGGPAGRVGRVLDEVADAAIGHNDVCSLEAHGGFAEDEADGTVRVDRDIDARRE